MSILQFAFGTDAAGDHLFVHINYSRDSGGLHRSHDNDTVVGWWSNAGAADSTRTSEDIRKERAFARAYLNFDDDAEINWIMIRAVEASVADVVIVPFAGCAGTWQFERA
jgi:4-alpha-glucanotransferase